MSWQDFERLTGEAFRRRGYAVQETGGGGADNGIDLELERDGERHLVQCKQWRAQRVGVEVVRELYGAMAAQGAAGGWVVTPGTFTGPAREFAQGRNIELIDGGALVNLIQQARPSTVAPAAMLARAETRSAASPSCLRAAARWCAGWPDEAAAQAMVSGGARGSRRAAAPGPRTDRHAHDLGVGNEHRDSER